MIRAGGTPQALSTGSSPTFAGLTLTGPLLNADGTAAAPSYSFANEPGTGFSRGGTGVVNLSFQGTQGVRFDNSNGNRVITDIFALGLASPDVLLARDAANTLALKNANLPQEYRVYAGNGGFISNVKTATESLTIAAAATTVGATSIPAGAILLGVSVRVTTAIPTAATFTVTTTVGATALNTAAVSTTLNSTDPGTAAGASFRAAATTVTITPNLTPAAATGVVRLQYYYLQVTPATS